ncbi:MAG: hypothetical protein IAA85_01640 [Firmicutes bacterium]|nr:hypothetical protein [Candidatus Alectryobacillus merdavium]
MKFNIILLLCSLFLSSCTLNEKLPLDSTNTDTTSNGEKLSLSENIQDTVLIDIYEVYGLSVNDEKASSIRTEFRGELKIEKGSCISPRFFVIFGADLLLTPSSTEVFVYLSIYPLVAYDGSPINEDTRMYFFDYRG